MLLIKHLTRRWVAIEPKGNAIAYFNCTKNVIRAKGRNIRLTLSSLLSFIFNFFISILTLNKETHFMVQNCVSPVLI